MSCYHHPEEEAVAQCNNCGTHLCRRCASLYSVPLCASCANAGAEEVRADMKKLSVIGIVLAVAAVIIGIGSVANGGNFGMLLGVLPAAYIVGSIPFGWRALTSITPRMFLFLPLIGWIIYFVLKFYIALLIGWVACPIQLRKMRQIINTVEETEHRRYKEMSKLEREREQYYSGDKYERARKAEADLTWSKE